MTSRVQLRLLGSPELMILHGHCSPSCNYTCTMWE